jgi:pimeloyl-ACP methyl ester carboxylesterase
MAADVARVIQQKCDGEAAVIGHSMGGKAAMTLALQYPDKVSRLCVLDIAPKDYDHSYSDLIHAMQALDFAQVKSRGDVEKAMLATTHDIGFARFLAQNAGRDSQKGFKWNPNLPVLDAYMQDILQFPFVQGDAVYAGNTTVVRGGDSDYVLPEDIKIYQSYFPHVDMRGVAGAGHWLHAEKPQDTLQELRRFLASPQR